jgi:hypothetical protein
MHWDPNIFHAMKHALGPPSICPPPVDKTFRPILFLSTAARKVNGESVMGGWFSSRLFNNGREQFQRCN